MKKYLFTSLVVFAIACTALLLAFTRSAKPAPDEQDKLFIQKAALGNLAEIAAGQLAAAQGGSDTVKAFGKSMVSDHTACFTELKSIADSLQETLPSTPDNEHAQALQTLVRKTGKDFDRSYISLQIKDHQDAIALFQKEWNGTANMRLKAFAGKYLPIIQMHLQMLPAAGTVMRERVNSQQ